MICLECGNEMEKGALRNNGNTFFCPEGENVPLYIKHFLRKANAVVLPPSPWSLKWEPDWPVAWCCRKCKKIVIPYEDDETT